MGKKCVQNVKRLFTALGISAAFPQTAVWHIHRMFKTIDVPQESTQEFHSQYWLFSICNLAEFYPPSTAPTITTICLFNKNQ